MVGWLHGRIGGACHVVRLLCDNTGSTRRPTHGLRSNDCRFGTRLGNRFQWPRSKRLLPRRAGALPPISRPHRLQPPTRSRRRRHRHLRRTRPHRQRAGNIHQSRRIPRRNHKTYQPGRKSGHRVRRLATDESDHPAKLCRCIVKRGRVTMPLHSQYNPRSDATAKWPPAKRNYATA